MSRGGLTTAGPLELAAPADRARGRAGARSAAATADCVHCGTPNPAGARFCCAGCEVAWSVINEHGLDRYYELPERRSIPSRSSGRAYAEFDHEAFQDLYVHTTAQGLCRTELYLEGVHCASCVWLVEKLPLLLDGVARAELDVRRSLARVEWDATALPLSAVARQLDALGYPPHPYRAVRQDEMRRMEDRAMLVKLGVSGAIAINVMLLALALYSGWLGGMEPQWQRLFRWISLLLVTPAVVWPGSVFFRGALGAIRSRTLNMDVPLAVGIGVGYLRGAVNTIADSGPVYFDGLAVLIFALLAGRYLHQRGQRAAVDSTELLHALTPATARIESADGAVQEIPSQAVVPGMLLHVRPGDTLAADGVVTSGNSAIDCALLTGESRAQSVGPDDVVWAGTVNTTSPIRVRVTHSGEFSRLAQLMRRVEESAQRRAPVVQTANRMAALFVAAVLLLAAATWLLWLGIDPTRATDNAIALLIVTCPCALALSTPLAVSAAIGRAARRGILIKGGDSLEALAHPGVMLLDKTGTITRGRLSLLQWEGDESIKPLVLALEAESTHPVARAFAYAWSDLATGTSRLSASNVVVTAGAGIRGTVAGREITVGSRAFVLNACSERVMESTVLSELARAESTAGNTGTPEWSTGEVLVAVDGNLAGRALVGDAVRESSRTAVAALQTSGWSVELLSGDAPAVVRRVADMVGIDPIRARGEASPEQKLAVVHDRLAEGRPVVMVGDGVNDAAAMAAATVGVGVHGGAEVCLRTADVYLSREGLTPLVELAEGARRTMRVIRRNITFSIVYNVAGASLAMAGLLNPLVAAILMPASSLTVVLSSWRSRTFSGESR